MIVATALASALLILALVAAVAALFVAGSMFTRQGEQIEKKSPRGTRPEPPGFRKPPGGDGGLL
jgi:hypothetical protein